MRQCAPKILETNSKSIFQSSTIVENTWTCPQFHILKPAHFVQPQHFKLYLYYPMISSICSTCSSPGQASGLSTGVPPGGQSAVSLSPMTYLSIKNHKKPGSSDHFLFHRKTITNLKVAVNLLHLASLNCFEHFPKRFQLL